MKEIIKIQRDVNERENKNQRKINEAKSCFFEKNKFNKTLARVVKKKSVKTQITIYQRRKHYISWIY